MIKIKENKKSKKQNPVYSLKINYMIGDGNGYTSEEGEFSVYNAEAIEKFCKILDKLKPVKGSWGIMLNEVFEHYFEDQITLEESLMWSILTEGEYEYNEELEEEYSEELSNNLKEFSEKFAGIFQDLIRAETEYSFLVYQSYELKYHDENGVKHNTYFENE